MTDPRRPDPPDRDPALAAAWKTHATELPPPRIDAAILAAAHRETRSRPRAVGDDDAHARGPSRAWWGLAAAATIGAIAFGVVQLAPREGTEERASVASDVPSVAPAPAPPAPASVQKLEAPAADTVPPPRDKSPPPMAEQREPAVAAMRAPAQAPDPKPVERERRREQAPASAAPEQPASPPAAPQPFPGAANTMAPPAAPAQALVEQQETKRAADARADGANTLRQRAAGKPAAQAARSEAQSAPGMGIAPRETDRAARTPAAWIEEIRKLYETQRFTDAARELNAFRTAYVDADARLPESLRAWAATVARN